MASRNIKSATSERKPNDSGRATSAGKGGMSSCTSREGARNRSARHLREYAAAAQTARDNTTSACLAVVPRDISTARTIASDPAPERSKGRSLSDRPVPASNELGLE